MGNSIKKDYIIIGAGPAGLQVAYYLEQKQRDYLILERGDSAGETFKLFPRHRMLISINKRFTGSDNKNFNLRHDWNSLLSEEDDFWFRNYDHDFFPKADKMVTYLEDYKNRYHLNVQLNTEVSVVERDDDGVYCITDIQGNSYETPCLIVATGFLKPRIPDIRGIEHAEVYNEMSLDLADYENKRVLILGKGNSGFETADHIVSAAALIHVSSPNPIKMAWKTHYVGNLRAINNNFLDTYQLKSQNAVLDADINEIKRLDSGKLSVTVKYAHAQDEVETLEYDKILVCTGFMFDRKIFGESAMPDTTVMDKFPSISPNFESTNLPNLFFAGTLTHSLDYKKATSGFIHGFRYNCRALCKILEERFHGEALPGLDLQVSVEDISRSMLERINTADGIWQQPGFLADLFLVDEGQVKHIEELPLPYINSRFEEKEYFTLTLEYGPAIMGDPFNVERIHRDNVDSSEQSQFLHPVVRYFKDGVEAARHDVIEDLEAKWTEEVHIRPLRAFIEEVHQFETVEVTGEKEEVA